ncbi:MAG: hypothetical protein HQK89_06790 [Nitrospirae bacterium]|nr:hypothetical protein [Nitrospirota bacterium]
MKERISKLVSIDQLAEVWKSYGAIAKLIQRKKITQITYISKHDALEAGLSWLLGGGGGKAGLRPFIDLRDPYIPAEIKQYFISPSSDIHVNILKKFLKELSKFEDKYISDWIYYWNYTHPDMTTSYPRLMASLKLFKEKGRIIPFMSKRGKQDERSILNLLGSRKGHKIIIPACENAWQEIADQSAVLFNWKG